MTTYETLYAAVSPIVKAYRDDLTKHDRAFIEDRPGVPFLHFALECGTHIIGLIGADEYPAKGERVQYIFGTANRDHILSSTLAIVDQVRRCGTARAIHHFDGHRLHKVDLKSARRIVMAYMDRIQAEWRGQERRTA